MLDLVQQLDTEITRFQAWVHAYPEPEEERSPEWDRQYEGWPALWKAFEACVAALPCQAWSDLTTENVVFAITHDTDRQGLIREVAKRPDNLLCLAERVLAMSAPNAAWQTASELGKLGRSSPRVESLLLRFTRDEDEYVRRRALLALADMGSVRAADPDVVERIWHSGVAWDEYGRMAVLYALWKIHSPQLEHYLAFADSDGRPSVVEYAARVRAGTPES